MIKYAVLTFTKPYALNSVRVYSKMSSVKETMEAYYKEIKAKHGDHAQVILTTASRAKAIKYDYYHWYKEYEARKLCPHRFNNQPHKIALSEYKILMENR